MTKLYAAIDIIDDILGCGFFPDKQHLAALMKHLRKLKVRRLEWVVNDAKDIHLTYPHGFDLETEAVQAAHREGIEFHAVYKPFEGVGNKLFLPHEAPCPTGTPVWRDERGVFPGVEPFIAENPELCLEIRPDLPQPEVDLTTLRIALSPDSPVQAINDHAFSLWTGRANGQFERYTQPFSVSLTAGDTRTSDKIPSGPFLMINDLNIGPDTPYLKLRNEKAGALILRIRPGGKTLECLNNRGELLPNTPDTPSSLISTESKFWWLLDDNLMLQAVPWGKTREAKRFLADKQKLMPLLENTGRYDCFDWELWGSPPFPEGSSIGAFRGKPRNLPGVLNPVYPEVRAHWLDRIGQLLDCGVDGVNIRPTHHLHPTDYRDYGFNPPVLEACHGKVDWQAALGLISDAFTQFLREARDVLHARGKTLGVHFITGPYFERPPTTAAYLNLIPGIGRHWRTWIGEIADYAEFRVGVRDDPKAMAELVDPVAEVCRRHGVPLIYQGNLSLLSQFFHLTIGATGRGTMGRTGESLEEIRKSLAGEMALVQARPNIDAYLLYETNSFVRFEKSGGLIGCADVENILGLSGFSDKEEEI